MKYMKIIDETPLTDMSKLWIYQHVLLSQLSWPFTVYDFDESFINSLQNNVDMYLKRWCQVPNSTSKSFLFRSREAMGIQLTSINSHYKSNQIVRMSLLKHSIDENARELYNIYLQKEKHNNLKWKPATTLDTAERQVSHELKYPTQTEKKGIGSQNKMNINNITQAEFRRRVCDYVRNEVSRGYTLRDHNLKMQGDYLKWDLSHNQPYELTWARLLQNSDKYMIRFLFRSITNTSDTPYNRHLWWPSKFKSPLCVRCREKPGTIDHILAGCVYMLNQGRYTFRHDSVLSHIEQHLKKKIDHISSTQKSQKPTHTNMFDDTPIIPSLQSSFVRPGEKPRTQSRKKHTASGILQRTTDWSIYTDIAACGRTRDILYTVGGCLFTNDRPDCVLVSHNLMSVVIIELTCPLEKNVNSQHVYKSGKYLWIKHMMGLSGWKVDIFAVEVSVRGCASSALRNCLKTLGFSANESRHVITDLQRTAIKSSAVIYMSHHSPSWTMDSLF
jgi:hypothetical protein